MGRVAWIGVEKGDKVLQGQVLVRLEDSDFRAQSNQARANLAAAQARLDQMRTGSRPQEKLTGQRQELLQAEATLRNAEADMNDRKAGSCRGFVESRNSIARLLSATPPCIGLKQRVNPSAMTDVGPRAEEIRAATRKSVR